MKERNKSIFRILLFASVGILLAQTVLMVVLGDNAEVRIMLPVIIFFSELITGVMIAYFTLNPQYNRNYTIHRRDGRWPDPDGMRYISAGVGALMIALLFAVISFAVLCPHVVNETVLVIAVVVLLSTFCVIYCIIENKLRKQL